MGNDRKKLVPPPPAPAPTEAKPKAKGHRQRGAGTVVASRGDITVGGITLKEWQRTPCKLLEEFCQSTKRPMPKYSECRRGEGDKPYKFRVTLPDPKTPGSDKDLEFFPDQYFQTANDAKHAVALLPLLHFCRERPLERKLPDPFREMWLALLSSAPVPSTKPSIAAPAPAPAARPSPVVVVAEATSATASSVTAEEPVISMSKKFASKAERAAHERERDRVRAEAANKRAMKRAWEDSQEGSVHMSEANREYIQAILDEFFKHQGSGSDGSSGKAVKFDAAAHGAVLESLKAVGFAQEYCEAALTATGSVDSDELLDWLCAHVPEDQLPAAFNPKGKQFEVIVRGAGGGSHPSIRQLEGFGFRTSDCMKALHDNGGDFLPALFALHTQLIACCDLASAKDAVDSSTFTASPSADTSEEVEGLVAILGEECVQVSSAGSVNGQSWTLVTLTLGEDSETLTGAKLHCYLPSPDPCAPLEVSYPNRPPLVFLTADKLQACARLSVVASQYASCWGKVGAGMLYDIMLGVVDDISSNLASHLTNTATHKHLFPSVTPPMSVPEVTVVHSSAGSRSTGKIDSKRPDKPRREEHRVSGDALASLRARLAAQTASEGVGRMLRERAKLPASAAKDSILAALRRDQVVLISGQTGCGKTTQVPQFILDDVVGDASVSACKIVCTQPRRLAAIGVANRVADERCEVIGNTVGYQIRGEKRMSKDTCLVFCTTGVLLRQLQEGLAGVTHIIVDEVHERSVDTDFLLAVLKRMLPKYPSVKVVLMSATMEASTFAKYFDGGSRRACSIIEIPGRTFPVRELYLDDVLAVTDVPFQLPKRSELFPDSTGATPELSRLEIARLSTFADALFNRDSLDYNCLTAVITALATGAVSPLYPASAVSAPFDPEGAILVFMPGVVEIRKLQRKLQDALAGTPVLIFPLHGNLTPDEQSQVFRRPPRGTRKIVLATNVAETSITIDDISIVVDTGRVKEMRYDPVSKTGHLKETWTSQDSSNQRRGRAGRVREGLCVRCYPSAMWAKLSRHTAPEILRTPLQSLCLQIKLLELGAIHSLLAQMIDAPAPDAVTVAVHQLVEVGALQPSEAHAHDYDLTALGRCVALLPVEVSAGKMLIYGVLLRCLDPLLTVASAVSAQSPFRSPQDQRDVATEAQKKFVTGKSDHLAVVKAYDAWFACGSMAEKRRFCKEHFLSFESLQLIHETRADLASILRDVGFLPNEAASATSSRIISVNMNADDPTIVKAAICAGLYPNLVRVMVPHKTYVATASGSMLAHTTAQQLKFYVKSVHSKPTAVDEAVSRVRLHNGIAENRVFLHPSSFNFNEGVYPSPWLVYNEIVQTSKLFVRDCTNVSNYAVLLFGGGHAAAGRDDKRASTVRVHHAEGTVCVGSDDWVRFRAPAKIGVLIKHLRRALDCLFAIKIQDAALDISQSPVVDAVIRLLTSGGV